MLSSLIDWISERDAYLTSLALIVMSTFCLGSSFRSAVTLLRILSKTVALLFELERYVAVTFHTCLGKASDGLV